MNKVILCGRLTGDPEIQPKVTKFTVAVNRGVQDGADFINCACFGKLKDNYVDKYVHKGDKVLLCGRVNTGSYNKQDGGKVYYTNIVVGELSIIQAKNNSNNNNAKSTAENTNTNTNDGFANVDDFLDNIPQTFPY